MNFQAFPVNMVSAHRSGARGIPLLPAQCFPLHPEREYFSLWEFWKGLPWCLGKGQAGLALHFPVSIHSTWWAFLGVWRCRWHLGPGSLRHHADIRSCY